MNHNAMPHHPFRALALAMALVASPFLSSCSAQSGTAQQAPLQDAPLYGADIGGPFELTDKHGATVRWSDFEGKWRIVYFGYAYCPDVCPTDVQRLMQGYRIYAKQQPELAANIQPIFITIDPERDTPKVVGEFAAAFSDKLLGLTGTPEQVKQAADGFRVFYSRGKTTDGGGYLMDHSAIAYLFDAQGKPVATLPTDLGPEAVAAELAKWVR